MRILHSIRSANPAGGGPIEGIKQLAGFHLREGREVEVVCLDSPHETWIEQFPVRIHALGPVRAKYGFCPRLLSWLRTHGGNYDAIIVNGLWQFNSLAVWHTMRRLEVPYYVFTHGMLDPWFKRTYPLKHLKKWLYWPWAEYRVLRDARAVFFTCEQERLLARQSFWLYRCREIVLGYGTTPPPGEADAQRATFLQQFHECEGRRVWLFLSRIHEKKGCDLLLKAFARVAARDPSLHLVMAGPDQTGWLPALQQLSVELGIAARITWAGMLHGDLKWGALRAAEVFILPSHQENFGIAVAEALACGVPVLISDQVNIWREIEADGAGLVEPDTLAGTLKLCERWLELPDEGKRRMRENAPRCFQQRFEMEQVARRLTAHLLAGQAAGVTNAQHGVSQPQHPGEKGVETVLAPVSRAPAIGAGSSD